MVCHLIAMKRFLSNIAANISSSVSILRRILSLHDNVCVVNRPVIHLSYRCRCQGILKGSYNILYVTLCTGGV